jgi:hypothetical protein
MAVGLSGKSRTHLSSSPAMPGSGLSVITTRPIGDEDEKLAATGLYWSFCMSKVHFCGPESGKYLSLQRSVMVGWCCGLRRCSEMLTLVPSRGRARPGWGAPGRTAEMP